jgi:hypothetical protein
MHACRGKRVVTITNAPLLNSFNAVSYLFTFKKKIKIKIKKEKKREKKERQERKEDRL